MAGSTNSISPRRRTQVIGKVVKSEDIPAATQLFTPNWIVKYLVQNTLGRKWMATYPDSRLKEQMEYYIEPAEQTPEVQAQLKEITPDSLNPEELTLLDPACGSGHILVEAYDVFKAIYQERGYRAKDIPRLILQKNLFGLEIDDRAAQLAAFALMMKAREDDRRIFYSGIQPHVLAIQESKGLDAKEITEALNAPLESGGTTGDIAQADITHLFDLFTHGKTFGSLVRVPDALAKKTIAIAERIRAVHIGGSIFAKSSARRILPLIEQTALLTKQYDAVVANPPYMGNLFATLTTFAKNQYPNSKADLFAMFIERGLLFAKYAGHNAMVTMHSWMFLSTYAKLRQWILHNYTIESMAHLGPRAFGAISGEVVQVTAFVLRKMPLGGFRPTFFGLVDGNEEAKRHALATLEHSFTDVQQSNFEVIPGSPIAYWATPAIFEAFQKGIPLAKIAEPRQGLATADNDRFIRRWYEVDIRRIEFWHDL